MVKKYTLGGQRDWRFNIYRKYVYLSDSGRFMAISIRRFSSYCYADSRKDKGNKMSNVATCTIKYTEAEISLLINSLEMTTSAKVACVDNGRWKNPYEKLKNDLISIKRQLIEYKRQKTIEGVSNEQAE